MHGYHAPGRTTAVYDFTLCSVRSGRYSTANPGHGIRTSVIKLLTSRAMGGTLAGWASVATRGVRGVLYAVGNVVRTWLVSGVAYVVL